MSLHERPQEANLEHLKTPLHHCQSIILVETFTQPKFYLPKLQMGQALSECFYLGGIEQRVV